MRRLHVTIVLLGGLIMVGSLVIATTLLSGAAAPSNATAAASMGNVSATPADVATAAERPPLVRVLGADGGSTTSPFEDRNWTETAGYVHVGVAEATEKMPVAVLLLNSGSERSLPVTVRHRPSNTTLYDRRPTLASGEALVFVFHEPSAYATEVRTDGEATTVGLQPGDFDCNERTFGVAVDPDGSTDNGVTATMSYCQ